MARRVDEEVRAIVMRGYDRAQRVVTDHRAARRAMAQRLLAKESLDAEAIRQVLRQHGVRSDARNQSPDRGPVQHGALSPVPWPRA